MLSLSFNKRKLAFNPMLPSHIHPCSPSLLIESFASGASTFQLLALFAQCFWLPSTTPHSLILPLPDSAYCFIPSSLLLPLLSPPSQSWMSQTMALVFVFYGSIAEYHKLCHLEQCKWIIRVSAGQESGHRFMAFSAEGLTRLNSGCF